MAEKYLAAAELYAVGSARPTDGAAEFLELMYRHGRRVAVVSNNSQDAIQAYLRRQSLSSFVAAISARDPSDAQFMKPHPKTLHVAIAVLECPPAEALMIGDSESDIMAARAAGVRVIALANKAEKAGRLSAAAPDALITSMRDLMD